jgi:hypothetical protein
VGKNYQRKERKSNHKLEVVRGPELLVRVPLPMAEVWAEMQTYQIAAPAEMRTPNLHRENRSTKSADGRMATGAARLKGKEPTGRKKQEKPS